MQFFNWLKEKISNRLSVLYKPLMLSKYKQGSITLKNVRISNTTYIHAKEHLVLADHVFIGHYNFIEASNGIVIEEGCQITNFVSITSHSSHISIRLYGDEYSNYSDLKGYIKGPVYIGKYSYIGPHSVIMPHTKIGKGSIVAAYSYVKGEFPDFSIIAGNPAKVVGDTRQLDENYLKENPNLRTFYNKWASQK
ncbi:MAG: acyltransferase [Bacteroidales bacterium]|nr:acyltransferase [Bacteroidales bacterium]